MSGAFSFGGRCKVPERRGTEVAEPTCFGTGTGGAEFNACRVDIFHEPGDR